MQASRCSYTFRIRRRRCIGRISAEYLDEILYRITVFIYKPTERKGKSRKDLPRLNYMTFKFLKHNLEKEGKLAKLLLNAVWDENVANARKLIHRGAHHFSDAAI